MVRAHVGRLQSGVRAWCRVSWLCLSVAKSQKGQQRAPGWESRLMYRGSSRVSPRWVRFPQMCCSRPFGVSKDAWQETQKWPWQLFVLWMAGEIRGCSLLSELRLP